VVAGSSATLPLILPPVNDPLSLSLTIGGLAAPLLNVTLPSEEKDPLRESLGCLLLTTKLPPSRIVPSALLIWHEPWNELIAVRLAVTTM
jgi:hypothetical protein